MKYEQLHRAGPRAFRTRNLPSFERSEPVRHFVVRRARSVFGTRNRSRNSIFFFNEEHPNTPPFGPSCTLSLKVYLGAEAKKEVVSRDTDIMTENEMITHKR